MYKTHIIGFGFCCFKSCALCREEENYHVFLGRILLLLVQLSLESSKKVMAAAKSYLRCLILGVENFPQVPQESSWITGLHEKDQHGSAALEGLLVGQQRLLST